VGLVQLLLFLLGKFGITISFAVVFVFTAELFPTELRHSTLACCSMLGRIGSVIAPQTPLLVSGFLVTTMYTSGGRKTVISMKEKEMVR
jgi:MFS family permease